MAVRNSRYRDIHKHHSLIDKVWSTENLVLAWKKVKANKGAPGHDAVTIDAFGMEVGKHLATIQRQLREKRYDPTPVKRVYIPKKSGKMRPLGIPTVKDRVVQQALRQVLEPIFEETFVSKSYGYRPNKSALQAVEMVRRYVQLFGYRAVADMDIKGFFDNVDHEVLLDLVNEKVSDGSVLALIRKFLEAGVMEEGRYEDTELGTPQGGVISPLLANIYLHHLDRRLKESGKVFVRYADDVVILAESLRDARRALNLAKVILEEDLKLKLNGEKTSVYRVVKIRGVEFLGYRITLDKVQPTQEAVRRFKDKVRFLTRRQQGRKVENVIWRLNPVLRGWGNYYRKSTIKVKFWDLDQWIQRRIRGYIKKRWWRTDIRRIPTKELLGMGLTTLESVMNIPRPLKWRALRGHNFRT
jgi:RNA-directed DNA polymerase